MGRTIPSFRIALYLEQRQWSNFRNELDRDSKLAFNEVFEVARLYISAGMMACRPARLEVIMISIVFHHFKQLVNIIEDGFEN